MYAVLMSCIQSFGTQQWLQSSSGSTEHELVVMDSCDSCQYELAVGQRRGLQGSSVCSIKAAADISCPSTAAGYESQGV